MRRLAELSAFALLLSVAARACVACADDLDTIKQKGTLVWGADQEGGGPYVYPRDDDPARVTGFEVELADLVAKELGVKASFFQGNWDKLPDLLRARQIDIVLNGYELTPERAAVMAATKPYYIYGLSLLVRADSGLDLAALKVPQKPKRKIGVLTGSAAETLARAELGAAVEIAGYDGNTDAMREVETGKLAATFQDTPIVAFYGTRFPKLEVKGEPLGEGHYVMYARPGEARLTAEIDRALLALYQRGELERLYRRYGMWNAQQAGLGKALGAPASNAPDVTPGLAPDGEPAAPPITAAPRKRGLEIVREQGPILLRAAGMTVLLSMLSFPLASALGLGLALARRYGNRWVRGLVTGYVEILRGTPLMLQLFAIFFFLPEIGVRFSAFATAIIGLSLNYSAYEAEIYRAGLGAVGLPQSEAARALGLSESQTLVHVVLPQAIRVSIPPAVNDFVALFKDTSICSVVTVIELTKRYSVVSMSTQATVELTVMTAILYLAMSLPISFLARKLEARLDPRRGRS
jgi:polar amino acid transport system substrate-binding protein